MTAHYKSIYAAVRADGFIEPLFSGIAPMMATLEQDRRCVLGAVTGKSRRGLVMIETSHGMERSFRVSRTADDCPSKPHPAMVSECCAEAGILPGRTVVIGDAVYDMQMAKAAGALAVGVAWGYARWTPWLPPAPTGSCATRKRSSTCWRPCMTDMRDELANAFSDPDPCAGPKSRC